MKVYLNMVIFMEHFSIFFLRSMQYADNHCLLLCLIFILTSKSQRGQRFCRNTSEVVLSLNGVSYKAPQIRTKVQEQLFC